jgi:hypothetical protein
VKLIPLLNGRRGAGWGFFSDSDPLRGRAVIRWWPNIEPYLTAHQYSAIRTEVG